MISDYLYSVMVCSRASFLMPDGHHAEYAYRYTFQFQHQSYIHSLYVEPVASFMWSCIV